MSYSIHFSTSKDQCSDNLIKISTYKWFYCAISRTGQKIGLIFIKFELALAGSDRVKNGGWPLRQFGRNSCSVRLTGRSNRVTCNSTLVIGIGTVGWMGMNLLLRMPTGCTTGVRDDHQWGGDGRLVRSVGVLVDHTRAHRLLVFLFFSGLQNE